MTGIFTTKGDDEHLQTLHMGVPPCPLHVVFPSSLKRRQLESNWTRCVVCDTLQFITKLIIFPRNLFVPGIFLFTCGESNFLLKLTFTVLLIALYHKLRWILPYFSWETKKNKITETALLSWF